MWYPLIPEFDSAGAEHLQLVALAESAEKLVVDFAFPENIGFQRARALIWGCLRDAGILDGLDEALRSVIGLG
ncbi:MAG TPA: hypothetical protein VIY52_23380 [Streptosporangiaceae bacterium]